MKNIKYKIVEYNIDNGELRSLFHPHLVLYPRDVSYTKTRKFPVGKWIKAIHKKVRDGSKSKYYLSGFHFFEDKNECIEYLKKFKDVDILKSPWIKVVMEVSVKGKIWKKEHSRSNVLLSKKMKILNKKYISKQSIIL